MMQEPPFVQRLFGQIARRYDLANRLLSGGMDILWRRTLAKKVAGWAPREVLDLATGSGDIALALRKVCPTASIIGADFSLPMLREAHRKGFQEVLVADGLALPFADESFDVVTVAFGLRNMASYPGAVREMRRVLRPGGHLLVLDFSVPKPPLRWVYRPYLHYVLPVVAGWLTGAKGAYQYLGASIEAFPAGREMEALLCENGFAAASSQQMSGGIVTLYAADAGE